MTEFDGPALKLRRARHHFDALGQVLEQFAASKPFAFYTEPRPKPPNAVLRVRVNRTVPEDCGLIVGDFAHNARSALDLLIHELSTLAPTDKQRRKLQFPICDDEASYRQNRDRWLRGVGAHERKTIEQFQPYQSSGEGSNGMLRVLAEINNSDKHRVIPVVAALGRLDSLADTRGIEFSADALICLIGSRSEEYEYRGVGDGILTDGAILAELKFGPGGPWNLQPNVSAVIQFGGNDAGVTGRELVPTLASILNRTVDIVKRFRGP